MKKIFLLLMLCFFVGAVSAQFASGVQVKQTTSDTIKTGALTVNKIVPLTAGYQSASFQVVVTKVSGTVAGKVYFKGTIDGTNYVNIDSLTLANVTTNTKVFTDVPAKYAKYNLQGVGSGTMNALQKVYYLSRKTVGE